MKYLLLLLPFNAMSAEYDIKLDYLSINQKLFGKAEFHQKALMVGVSYWHESGLGLGVSVGKGNNAKNEIHANKLHENEINFIASYLLKYRYSINENLLMYAEVGKTEYRTTWRVNGVKPNEWCCGWDSGDSYGIGAQYNIGNNLALSLGYSDIYRKNKKGFGKENTTSLNFGLIYYF